MRLTIPASMPRTTSGLRAERLCAVKERFLRPRNSFLVSLSSERCPLGGADRPRSRLLSITEAYEETAMPIALSVRPRTDEGRPKSEDHRYDTQWVSRTAGSERQVRPWFLTP